ncbi:MAG TPA: sialidase family protein [Candidatus Thermoplasmatota archaeon]|nr:sialidase family protein [Candidatus Thermoplasmatota archaeon]
MPGRFALVLALLLAGCASAPDATPTPDDAAAARYHRSCDLARGNASWTETCLALASPNDSPSKTEIDLAVNPTDPRNVVVSSKDVDPKASKCVWAVPQVSKDGGATWTTSYIGGEMASRQPTEPLFGWQCITDPIMAFDADGTLYYSLQAYDHTVEGSDVPTVPGVPNPVGTVGSAIFAARSTDGGLTWDKIVTLHLGDGANVFHDYMRVLVNPKTGTYHTIWNQFTGQAQASTVVPVLVSWDGESDRANAPVYIPIPDRPEGVVMAGFAAASDGTLYVLIEDGDDAWFTASTDDGATFSAPVLVPELHGKRIERQALGDDAFRTTGSYELVVDNSGGARDGWLYATISDCTETCDVFVARSEDGGATWSNKTRVNDGAHLAGYQWIPRPFVDRLGNLHLVYLDSSRNVGNDTWIDATWALSTDGGATWNNTYLTDRSFDGNLGIHQDGFPFIGDYLGIGGAGDWVYMGFPTTVTGRAEIAVAKVRLPDVA